MDFRPLNDTERRQLIAALRGNAENDRAILMDRRNTSFLGSTEEVTDDEGEQLRVAHLAPVDGGAGFLNSSCTWATLCIVPTMPPKPPAASSASAFASSIACATACKR